ncbi:MAG TPA: D-alanine--D-alanine ligase [Kiritimatiellia bacterium]|nr:D-alanine--D-alanine ligase [Kiritimatiellia bacterium]HRZ11912.1 D-alanine--D-alanine ligase [Kiritimatiellia bacterium]HSA17282.1 D-alanine--D-alanine ligase [Kiritimatiellia bacterium]
MTKKKFRRVAVLKGGPSAEREVSLRSGAGVAKGLREAGYEVDEILLEGESVDIPSGVEAVFIALHGRFGEDGGLQEMLRRRGIAYTGSGPEASRRSFDKRLTKQALVREGLPTPAYEVLRDGQARTLPLPVVVKPPCQGSSIGVYRAMTESEWPGALAGALEHDAEVLVESFVEGRELTVSILDGEALPVLEIRPLEPFFSYTAKYTAGRSEFLVPAPLPEETASRCRNLARRTFRALGAEGFGRVDFRLAADGGLFILELNTIPGFTETSLFPKAARAAGMTFPEVCDRIMSRASVH